MTIIRKLLLVSLTMMILLASVKGLACPGGFASLGSGIPVEECIYPPPNIFVPDNYSSIQEAINDAADGDVILIRSGTYYERLYIWHNVTVLGSFADTTIIDGSVAEYDGPVVTIYASGVGLMDFTIMNGEIGVSIGPAYGEYVSENLTGVAVQGIKFVNIWKEAIHAESCIGCFIEGNTISGSTVGISSSDGEDNSIAFNSLTGTELGINVTGKNDMIRHNRISEGVHGIEIWGGNDLIEYNKIFNEAGNSIRVIGSEEVLINGNEIGAMPEPIPEPVGLNGIILEGSSGIHLTNNLVGGMTEAGVLLRNSENNILEGTEVLGCHIGIMLDMSFGNKLTRSRAIGNAQGFVLEGSDFNSIIDNIVKNSECGIFLFNSNDNSLLFNLILLNDVGVLLDSSNSIVFDSNYLQRNGFGLRSQRCSDGVIMNSLFFLNEYGIRIDNSGGRLIEGNMIIHNGVGIALSNSLSANRIFHNVFFTDTEPAVSDGISMWDDGVGEGNFWSGYMGRDLNGDGIGDQPYMGLDRYPLMTIGYVESKPAKDTMDELRKEVLELNFGKGVTQSLLAKLDAAQKSFYKSNVGAALNQLEAFINEINALRRSGRINAETAQQLIGKARLIMALWQQSDGDFDDLSYEEERMLGTSPTSLDTDGDGMPDGWEAKNGLNPTNARDASADSDGDGVTNLGEYLAFSHMPEFFDVEWTGANLLLIQYVEHFEKRLSGSTGEVMAMGVDPELYKIAYVKIFHSLPFVIDSDQDGLGDSAESTYGTNPNDWDTDDDHMSDGWEVKFGLNPNIQVKSGDFFSWVAYMVQMIGDPDKDSIINRYEYWLTQMFSPLHFNYLNMNPSYKDLVVEVNWVPSFEPNWTQLNVVKTPFSDHAIKLHIIRGTELDSKYAVFSGTDPRDFWENRTSIVYADSRMDTSRTWEGLVRFAISVDNLGDGASGSSGNAYDIPNDMFAIAHCGDAGWVATCTSAWIVSEWIATTPEVAVAGTFMHELGHTLGLHHGGDVDLPNYKENYTSIMNYRYQVVGVDVTGDKKGDGGTRPATEVVNYSSGGHGTGDFDDWTYVINHLGDGIAHRKP